MKQYPCKAAENAHLLGAWKNPGLTISTPIKSRRAWHVARRQRRLGEQITHDFERQYGVDESKAAAARMKASLR